jgi:hypothetical protein
MTEDFTISQLKPLVMDLLSQERRPMVFDLLEIYYKKATTIEDFDTLGYLSFKAEHRQLYLKCAQAAYIKAENRQQLYIARTNLYKAYNVMNQPDQALFYIDINLQLTPDDFETQTQRAFNIALTGDKETSEQILLGLQEKHPHRAEDLRSALSGRMLRQGHTSEGIACFLNTVKPKGGRFETQLKMKRWNGMAQPGRTIYVDGEGGIGDEFINIRFFNNITSMGMKPILYSTWSEYRKDTVDLFRRHGHEVITETYSIDTSQLWAPMMSLPYHLNLNEHNLWQSPYLFPLRNKKNQILSKKFKIGIKCSGNPYFGQDEYRKIPVDVFLAHMPDQAEIYYIDKSPTDHPRLINLSDRIHSWEDTLDFVDQMDCVASSCTSLVHAAGAMGKTTLVAVPIAEYYIWSTSSNTTHSPWYGDNFHVFKQTSVNCWQQPLTAMASMIKGMIIDKTQGV